MRLGLNKRRLRLSLSLFLLALILPSSVLIYQAFSQLKWESFRHHQMMAEEVAARIDDHLKRLVEKEEARSFSDYSFLNVASNVNIKLLQPSPLSALPYDTELPGMIGYFQVDNEGGFSSPLLPQQGNVSDFGISTDELVQRQAVNQEMQAILSENSLVTAPVFPGEEIALSNIIEPESDLESPLDSFSSDLLSSVPEARQEVTTPSASMAKMERSPQAAFEMLAKEDASSLRLQKNTSTLGRIEELRLSESFEEKAIQQQEKAVSKKKADNRRLRKEQSVLPEPIAELRDQEGVAGDDIRITTFESELDPFSFSLLDSGHFVLFRKVWRNGERYIQGMLFEKDTLLKGVIESLYAETALSNMSNLVVAYHGDVLALFGGEQYNSRFKSAAQLQGELLYQIRLSNPLSNMQLIFSITQLPAGPGAQIVIWGAVILILVVTIGLYLLYRMGLKQFELVQQQQDFVSAVSHELKTPLTSIRMYGEMLREGWATDENKARYYDYIHDESERLSRLINNVLQLARLDRNELQLKLQFVTVKEVFDNLQSKISSQLERTDFVLKLENKVDDENKKLQMDLDAFLQIVINLVDNAIKFSAKSECKQVDIFCQQLSDGSVEFSVRDYGPGIAKDQIKKVFRLFYRSENELTRETVGTGIGLALVSQLAQQMNAKVDVVNTEPGVKFTLVFKS